MPADRLQIPIFISLFYVLKDFEKEVFPQYPGSSLDFLGLVDITEPTIDGWGPLLLVVYVISQLTSSYFMSTSMQKAQRSCCSSCRSSSSRSSSTSRPA